MGMDAEDDDSPRLSTHTLAALQEFLSTTQSSREDGGNRDLCCRLSDDGGGEGETDGKGKLLIIVPEDWRLSQFWYDQHTSRTVAQELFLLSKQMQSSIACISCPSLYVELQKGFEVEASLFEFDLRFQRYGKDFTFYDYNFPEKVPTEYHHSFQVVVADPPYLSRECIEKTVQTMKLMAKNDQACFMLLTGAVQQDHARDLLKAYPCGFKPTHQNKLGNAFLVYTSYDPLERLGGWLKH